MKNDASPEAAGGGVKRLLIFLCIAVVGLSVSYFTPLREYLDVTKIRTFADGLGWWGPVLIVAVGVIGPLAFLPRWPICFLCGLLYGVVWGALWANIASTFGAWVHYLVARTFLGQGTDVLLRKWKFDPARVPADKAFGILVLLRAFPLSNSAVTNVLAGALRLTMGGYLVATFIGMIPSTVMYVAWGKLLKRPSPEFYYLAVVLLLVAVAGTIWGGRRLAAYRDEQKGDYA